MGLRVHPRDLTTHSWVDGYSLQSMLAPPVSYFNGTKSDGYFADVV
jgi:hypothetical protein